MSEVFLRPWSCTDATALREAWTSSGDLGTQFGGADLSTNENSADYLNRYLVFGDDAKNWAIVFDGQVVGNIGMTAIEFRHQTAWMSYWLATPARGHLLATRSLVSVAEYAFAQGLFRLELGHRTNNPASCRVAKRAGFLPEGIQRQHLKYGDKRYDVEIHARLATDPKPDVPALELRLSSVE